MSAVVSDISRFLPGADCGWGLKCLEPAFGKTLALVVDNKAVASKATPFMQ